MGFRDGGQKILNKYKTKETTTTTTPLPSKNYGDVITESATKHGVDPVLVDSMAWQESRHNPTAVSPAGAQGVMQLMPKTAADLGVDDPFDPKQNIEGGAKYISQLMQKYNGDQALALAAYNAGMGNIDKAIRLAQSNKWDDVVNVLPQITGSKNAAETRDYVQKIQQRHTEMTPALPPVSAKEALASERRAQYPPGMREEEERAAARDRQSTVSDNPIMQRLRERYSKPELEERVSIWQRLAKEPQAISRAYGVASKGLDRAKLGYKLLTDTITPEEENQMKQLGFEIEQEGKLLEGMPVEGTSVGQILPSLVNSMSEAARGVLIGGSAGAVAGSFVPGVGSVVGAGIGASTGALGLPIAKAYEIEAGSSYLDQIDRGVDKQVAKITAHLYGAGSAALEAVGFKILKYAVPGGTQLTNQIFKTAIDNAVSKLSNPATRLAGRVGMVATGEASVEATQKFLSNLITELSAVGSDVLKETNVKAEDIPTFLSSLTEGVVETFATTALGMGITSLPGTSFNLLIDTKAGREAAAQAKKDKPNEPVEKTIKEKAKKELKKEEDEKVKKAEERKREPQKQLTPKERAPRTKTLREAEADKKVKEIIKAAGKEKPKPDPNADAPGPEGRGTTPSYPDRKKAVPSLVDETPAPTAAPKAPVTPVAKAPAVERDTRPIPSLMDVETTQNPATGEVETKATPTLHSFIDKYGTKDDTLTQMMSIDDTKGLYQNKLTQPAILLKDGTILEGTALSEPWSVSKSDVAIAELPDSYTEARKKAHAQGKDVAHAKAGFIVDGKFVPSSVVVGKFKIGKNINKQKHEMETARDEATQKEIDKIQEARDSWAKKVQESRPVSEKDFAAAKELQKAAYRAAKKARNSDIGKHLDISDLQSASREAMWMIILSSDPKDVSAFADGNNRTYFNYMVSSVGNALKNYKKEQFGPRRQVTKEMKAGTLKATVPLNEAITGETIVDEKVPMYAEEGNEARTVQQSSGLKAHPHAENVRLADMMPGKVKRIDPKTGKVTETIGFAQAAAELLDRRRAIAAKKEVAAQKATESPAPVETMPVTPAPTPAPAPKAPAKPKATPTEKLGKTKQAKPTGKEKKPASDKLEVKAQKVTEGIEPAKLKAIRQELLKTPGAVVVLKHGTSFQGIRGATIKAGALNAEQGKGTWEVIPDADSVGNYMVVKSDVFTQLYDEYVEGKAPAKRVNELTTSAPTPPAGSVPNPGSIFEQNKKLKEKTEKASKSKKTLVEKAIDIAEDADEEAGVDVGTLPSLFDDAAPASDASISNFVNKYGTSEKTTKDIPSLLTNDTGSTRVFNDAINLVARAGKRIGTALRTGKEKTTDWFDVEAKWERVGKSDTGRAIKGIFGMIDSYQQRESKSLLEFAQIIHQNDKKITNEQLVDCALAAETPKNIEKLPENHQPIAQWIRDFFDASKKEFADKKITLAYKERRMLELQQTIVDGLGDWDSRAKTMRDMQKLKDTEFLHIPVAVLKSTIVREKDEAKILETGPTAMGPEGITDTDGAKTKTKKESDKKAKELYKRRLVRKLKSLENLAAKKRRAISLADILDHGVVKKSDINVYSLLGNYMRNKANDFALADLRDIAFKDGIIKIQKSKPKATNIGSWVTVPKNFKGLTFIDKAEGENVWVQDSMLGILQDSFKAVQSNNKFTKLMSIVKMAQFYNPLFLPMYNILQGAMVTNPWSLPKYIAWDMWNGMYHSFTHSEEYLEAVHLGLTSTPFGTPFKNWMAAANDMKNVSRYGRIGGALLRAGTKLLTGKDTSMGIPLLGAAYEASWALAWQMDGGTRFATYKYLIDKGLSKSEAAQMSAKFYGDYASVPATTRAKLNRVFFTPTFTISMVKLMYEMMEKSVGIMLGNKTNNDFQYGKAAIYTGMQFVAIDAAMRFWAGMDDEDSELGRRYAKRVLGEDGTWKELVLTIATPANVPFRLAEKFRPFFDPQETNPLGTSIKKFKYMMHPVWTTIWDLSENKNGEGKPIWNKFDSPKNKMIDVTEYIAKRVATMAVVIKDEFWKEGATEGKQEVKAIMEREFSDFAARAIPLFAFAYTRDEKDIRIGKQLQRLSIEFRKDVRRASKEERDLDKLSGWLNNYLKRLKETQEK